MDEKVGIALSGGGVRSASFSLGAIQALQDELSLLKGSSCARYISAVSGGSYTASAFLLAAGGPLGQSSIRGHSSPPSLLDPDRPMTPSETSDGHPAPPVAHPPLHPTEKHRKNARARMDNYDVWTYEIAQQGWRTVQPHNPLMPGTPEARHLRRHAQFMKSVGGLPGATLAFSWRLVLNLVYVAIVPFAFGELFGLIHFLRNAEITSIDHVATFVAPDHFWWVEIYVLAIVAAICLLVRWILPQNRLDARALDAASGAELVWSEIIVITVVFGFGWFMLPPISEWLWRHVLLQDADTGDQSFSAVGSLLAALGGGVTVVAAGAQLLAGNATRVGGASVERLRSRFAGAIKIVVLRVLMLLAWLLYPAYLITLSAAGWLTIVTLNSRGDERPVAIVLVIGSVALLVAIFVVVSPQMWSLHRPYLIRLRSCFAVFRQRRGQDERCRARPEWALPKMSDLRQLAGVPELLICASVNVSDKGASAAGTRVRPLVISPTTITLHAEDTFEFNTEDFEHALSARVPRFDQGPVHAVFLEFGRRLRFAPTVSGWVAITGAAVSPAMGKMTKGAFRSVLAALNLRLGQWIPNPASEDMQWQVKDKAATVDDPDSKPLQLRPRFRYFFRETTGIHSLGADLIYVTDGGHYENLGIVELIRQRCSTIWCIDASGDKPGGSMALSESLLVAEGELGVRVDFDTECFALDEDASAKGKPILRSTHASGTITHPDGAVTTLNVVKIGIDPETPHLLTELRGRYKRFPYDSTLNQLYNAERFDLYRELGYSSCLRAIRDVCPVPSEPSQQ